MDPPCRARIRERYRQGGGVVEPALRPSPLKFCGIFCIFLEGLSLQGALRPRPALGPRPYVFKDSLRFTGSPNFPVCDFFEAWCVGGLGLPSCRLLGRWGWITTKPNLKIPHYECTEISSWHHLDLEMALTSSMRCAFKPRIGNKPI